MAMPPTLAQQEASQRSDISSGEFVAEGANGQSRIHEGFEIPCRKASFQFFDLSSTCLRLVFDLSSTCLRLVSNRMRKGFNCMVKCTKPAVQVATSSFLDVV